MKHGSNDDSADVGGSTAHRFPVVLVVVAGLLVAGLVALIILGDSTAHLWDEWSHRNNIEDMAESIRRSGAWGVAVSIGLMIVHSFLPFPAEVIALANGIIYGIIFGTLITWTGAMLGAQAAFWTARAVGQSVIDRYVRADRLARVDRWIAGNGTVALLIMRLIPVIAFNLVNYVAGLARIRWWTFTWTTAVGILPLAFLMVAAGDQLKNTPLSVWAALPFGALLLWLLVKWLQRRHAKAALRQTRRLE